MANEKRLIDANALKGSFMFLRKMWSGTEISATIDEAPTVDAVEVVRCEDCKELRQKDDKNKIGWCPVCRFVRRYNDFCSYGERREGE